MSVHVRFEQTFPIRFPEWLLATILSGWGMMTLSHPSLFAVTPALSGMLAMAPQQFWGWSMVIVGLFGWAMLAINGAWRPSPMFRALCALLRGLIWLQFCFGLALTDLPSLGLVTFPAFVLTEMFNAYRAVRDVKAGRVQ